MISARTSNRSLEPARTQQDRYHSQVGLPQIDKTAHRTGLGRLQDRWRLLLQSPEPRLIIENGLYIDCNRAALLFLGLSRKRQLIGTHPYDCSPSVQPDGRLSVDKAHEILSSAVSTGPCRFEWHHQRSDSAVVPVEVSLTKLRIDGRDLIYTVWRDLTGHQFPTVSRSGTPFREVFEQSEDAIILLDPSSWRIVDANPSAVRLYGYAKDTQLKGGIGLFMEPVECEQFRETVRRHGREQGVTMEAVRHITKDGRRLEVRIRCWPITFHSITLLYCRFRDISYRVRLEQEAELTERKLIQTNKMASLGTLVSSVAHEINNPNSFIMLNSSLLKEAWADVVLILEEYVGERVDLKVAGLPFDQMKGAVSELISGVMDGSRRIDAIVTNLKEFSRPQKASKGPINVNKAIEMAASMLSSQIKRFTNRFSLDLDANIPELLGDSRQLEQVVINLVLNALQALPRRGCAVTVVSRLDKDKRVVMIRVEDEGTGISPEVLAHITEPFFSTKFDSGGTGLGVYISHSIIKGHGGSLEFESKEGEGTSAIISLPVGTESCEREKQATRFVLEKEG